MTEGSQLPEVVNSLQPADSAPSSDFVSEREKWTTEKIFRERDLVLKEQDLQLQREEQSSSGWRSPLVVAILAATLAAIGNAVIAVVNGNLQRDLDDRKAEQSRILEMVKIGDPDKAAANLDFLLKTGLISDPNRASKLESFLKTRRPGTGPFLPSPVASTVEVPFDEAVFVTKLPADGPLNTAVSAVGQLKSMDSSGREFSCTAFLIADDVAVTAKQCVDGFRSPNSAVLWFHDRRGVQSSYKTELVEASDSEHYALLKVFGKPGATRGFLELSRRAPQVGEPLAIVMFRGDDNEMAVFGSPRCSVLTLEERQFRYECSTRGGSSGSPVLAANGHEVLGVHLLRDLSVGGDFPSGVAVRADLIRHANTHLP